MDLLAYPFDGALILQKKRQLRRALLEKEGLIDKKVAIVGGSTVGDIAKILELFLLDKGIRPAFHQGGYGLYYENIVFDDGTLAAFAPDILYIHTCVHDIRHWPAPADPAEAAEDKLAADFAHFKQVAEAATRFGCPVVLNNFELPLWRNFGALDAVDVRGRVRHVRRLNEKLAELAATTPGLYIHDLNYLAATFGLDEWCDKQTWYAYKYCCAPHHIPDLCHSLAALMGSLFGRTKKAVVLDLDNTLWGGVIGEVGAEAVELGDETPAGRAFTEFQQYLKMLSERGILLNVASKNEVAPAESGFARADSPLKREDILCFEANWEPKPESIKRIAENLNILPDSFVFMDDNPAERALVERELPMVTVPPVTMPEASIALIDRAGYFEVTSLSADDAKRTEMYRQNAERQKMETNAGSYEEYLESLDMTAEIGAFTPGTLERVTQLINKTNQFNLTTRRYSAAETQTAMEDENTITISAKLIDRFGDNGITSALIAPVNGDTATIDLWVMSCRVFKRHLEYAVFDRLVEECQKRGVKRIEAAYLPTAKNLLVADFYAMIGFDLKQEEDTGARHFVYTVPETYEPLCRVIHIKGVDA